MARSRSLDSRKTFVDSLRSAAAGFTKRRLATLPRIDFVKVDIEGHEDCFFPGARQTFEDQRPAAMLEVNKAFFRAKGADLDQTLRPYLPPDYRLFHRVERRWIEVANFAACSNFENVFAVPAERLELDRYRRLLLTPPS